MKAGGVVLMMETYHHHLLLALLQLHFDSFESQFFDDQ